MKKLSAILAIALIVILTLTASAALAQDRHAILAKLAWTEAWTKGTYRQVMNCQSLRKKTPLGIIEVQACTGDDTASSSLGVLVWESERDYDENFLRFQDRDADGITAKNTDYNSWEKVTSAFVEKTTLKPTKEFKRAYEKYLDAFLHPKGDGIPSSLDRCPNTPVGVTVDTAGCELSVDKDLSEEAQKFFK
jgi:hypothetical protein